ncbi:hypothetical protein SAMN05216559_0184 [Halomicrobium zhouii]|uniref:Uncharacterized protein n=1 Tax=Halomicrobium zhouii TaxID=767519 RepID=A0A1I6K5P1_9EURY|nr:hypothetical protein [Halomicrobium zhouii]SFR86160.1 hypothetical protein SAMN05216559_0184 [Halomicrobium zhouii]
MDDALRHRLDAALLLLLATFLLVLVVAVRTARTETIGVLVLVGLIAISQYRSE